MTSPDVTFDATNDEVVQCPYGHYRSMRDQAPVLELDGAMLGRSGERVFAVVDMRQGDRLSIAPGLDTYGRAKQVIKHWVKRFVGRVDAAHGSSK